MEAKNSTKAHLQNPHFARALRYKDKQPVVPLIEKTYRSGVKLTQKLMAALEKRLKRLPGG